MVGMIKKFVAGLGILATLAIPQAFSTITDPDVRTVSALGNGSNQNFTIGFQFQDNDQLRVYLVNATTLGRTRILEGVGAGKYTVSGGNPGTTIVMGTAPTTSQYVVILRETSKTQSTDYDENSAFPAEDHEEQMDRMVQMIQELGYEVSTKIGLSTVSTSTAPAFPDPLANRFVVYNNVASGLVHAPLQSETFGSGYILKFDGTKWAPYDYDTATATLATSGALAAHLADLGNPHQVTANQVGNSTAQWNASSILGVSVDAGAIADGLCLQYESSTTEIIYGPCGGAVNSFETIDTPAGTDPVAESSGDTLALTSSDSTVVITGNSGTDTVNFAVGSNLVNANIDAAAAIARSKIASGSNDHVVINSGAGALSSEAQLATSRGGTGQNFSASTGALSVAAGTVSAGTLSVSNGGTGRSTITANNVMLGNGTSAVALVAPSTSGNVLTSNGTTWTSAAASAGNVVYWKGFHTATSCAGWVRTNTSYGNPAVDADCNLTESYNSNFGTVTSYESGGSELPGITFTAETAAYFVCAMAHGYLSTAGASGSFRLTDGSQVVDESGWDEDINSSETRPHALCGIYVGSAGTVTLRIETKASSGVNNLVSSQGGPTINWSIYKIK